MFIRDRGCIERGAIDCLVVGEAVATVVEFKTGAPRACLFLTSDAAGARARGDLGGARFI